ncbi:Rad52/Rad22 family DNA repair protein [Pluralibacter gergoviae]|uniref:Rad52/Rad22 family DNA repair protein n=1 Tax=Pluralibacter gergoviae TaxID=61647 RepID=UPI0028A157BB|nr:Rad52/Rad22 family DNA repair protein [Pluralibacter gergoviae]
MELSKLDEPFAQEDVEWRVQQCGMASNGPWAMVLCYVTNRAIMKRLDDVCGKAGWRNEYRDIPNNGGVECGISIKVDGEWITKWDAAENTQVEAVKGGRSGAMKRAAVQWGIGRYLYQLEERFAVCSTERNNSWNKASFKDKKTNKFGNLWWQTPELPKWALPPDHRDAVVEKFNNDSMSANNNEELESLYKAAWAEVGDSEEHKKQVVDIFKQRKSHFKKAA